MHRKASAEPDAEGRTNQERHLHRIQRETGPECSRRIIRPDGGFKGWLYCSLCTVNPEFMRGMRPEELDTFLCLWYV